MVRYTFVGVLLMGAGLVGCAGKDRTAVIPCDQLIPQGLPESPPLPLQLHGVLIEGENGERELLYRSLEQVDAQPELPGGGMALHSCIRFPKSVRHLTISGDALVAFVVEADGSVSETEVLRSPHEDLGEAAVRALRGSRFIPGRYEGSAAAMRVVAPISMRLNTR